MPETKATAIRCWDRMTITAWWDPVKGTDLEGSGWFNIRSFKVRENGDLDEKCIRLSAEEVEKLIQVIKYNNLRTEPRVSHG